MVVVGGQASWVLTSTCLLLPAAMGCCVAMLFGWCLQADAIVINTCGVVEDAKDESIEVRL